MIRRIQRVIFPGCCFVAVTLGGVHAGRATAPRPPNAIQRENLARGTTDWLLTGVEPSAVNVRDDRYRRQRAIEGYVSHTSIRAGEVLTVYVSTNPAASYSVEIYRLG